MIENEGAQPEGQGNIINRDIPEPHEARANLVKKWADRVLADKKHFEDKFKRVREDMRFAYGIQWDGAKDTDNDGRYTANIVLRHANQKVAALYAKNPKAIARRRKRLEYGVWDGNTATLEMAMMQAQNAMMGGGIVDQATMGLLADIAKAQEQKKLVDKIGKTLELVYAHYQDNQPVPFKTSMKKLVRRATIAGWAWVKLDFIRTFEQQPDVRAKISDITERLAAIERLNADLNDGEISTTDAEAEQLRLSLQALQAEPEILAQEGLTWHFPSPTAIIPDKKCVQLQGFVGADWVTEEFLLTPEQVKETYGVDLGDRYTQYIDDKSGVPKQAPGSGTTDRENGGKCMVWEIYSSADGLVYTVCDGYPDFLREPHAPNVKLERFYPFFLLAFNDVDSEIDIFPPSDTSLLRPMQKEYNRSRNGLREHRKANRPKYATPANLLSDDDKRKLQNHPANALLELQGLAPGQKVDDLLQAVKPAPIDPALYDTGFVMEDIYRVVGSQEANMGGASGATATETSIAEGSRVTGLSSNTDDLDDLLTDMARAGGQVLLMELSPEKAAEIAGPGATWPNMSRAEIAQELLLEVQAGSSGRPNRDKDVAILERLLPFMLQVPKVNPEWLLKQMVERIDDRIEIEDAILSGMPSITALNALAAKAAQPGGDPAAGGAPGGSGAVTPNGGGASAGQGPNDPALQGGQGAMNAPAAPAANGAPMPIGAPPNTDGRLGGASPYPSA